MKLKMDGTISKLKSITNRLMDFEDETEDSILENPPDITSNFTSEMHPFISVFIERKKMLRWTVEDIAQKTGISSTTILDVENGKQMATWNVLEKYANSIGLVISLIEETPIEDLLEKQGTTEIITNLEVGQIAYGNCGKYIKKDPVTKAIWECTKEGEPSGALSLTEEVMNSRWVILVDENKKSSVKEDDQLSQSELEKEIFLNVIYSDLDIPQLYSYLLSVKDKIINEELSLLVKAMCDTLQSIGEVAYDEEQMLKDSSQREFEKQILESKEKILQYFFKGVDLHKMKSDT